MRGRRKIYNDRRFSTSGREQNLERRREPVEERLVVTVFLALVVGQTAQG